MKKDLLAILLLLVLTVPAVKELFIPGAFTSHDLVHHVVRQVSMDKLLSDGQFPPRWSDDLNQGYGYPVFLFNYPLPALIGEGFHKMGLGFVDSVKAVLFFSIEISVVGMYLFLKSLLNSRLSAFLGAIFYVYAPLRFLNTYVSAAVGSALATGVAPYVFWSLVEISKKRKWAIFSGAFSFAALILAHNVSALILAPLILSFALILILQAQDRADTLKKIGAMLLLGLGLSAWFFVPAILEKSYTRFDAIYTNFYQDQFVTLEQLLRSPWGYGLSHPQNPGPGDMSYQLGLIQIGVVLILLFLFCLSFLRPRAAIALAVAQGGNPVNTLFYGSSVKHGMTKEDRLWMVFVLTAFFLSIFLMLKVSESLWVALPFLSLIQFPIRFQIVSVFAAAISAGLLVKYLPFRTVVFCVLLVLVVYANRNHWHINEVWSPGENYFINLKTTGTTYGEHLPKWGEVAESKSLGKLEFVNGKGIINIKTDKSNYVMAEVEASSSSQLRFNQYYFPGWEIKVDGQKVNFNYLTDGKSYGLPVFDIVSGSHLVKLEFKNTAVRDLSDFISLVTFLGCLGLILTNLHLSFRKFK
ncbi:MAG: hypothetical protein Q7R49_07295 [Candidatus Daviesbacteria bacterium]|nr:hypothetical protein [Candidatus Daviesbacteria bacterium]